MDQKQINAEINAMRRAARAVALMGPAGIQWLRSYLTDGYNDDGTKKEPAPDA